jgi:hypothetical protein
MFRLVPPILAAAVLGLLTLVPVGLAGQPVIQTLTPPPPSFETCRAAGLQTICEGNRTESYGPVDNGFSCGSGASAFEVFDQGVIKEHAVRYYDENGNLTRRTIHDVEPFGAWSNPLTGAMLRYTQSYDSTDVLAVPGDLSSATETITGDVIFTVPGLGVVLLNAGKFVVGADGSLEFRAGPQGILDYFVNGDTSAFEPMCAALGAA